MNLPITIMATGIAIMTANIIVHPTEKQIVHYIGKFILTEQKVLVNSYSLSKKYW